MFKVTDTNTLFITSILEEVSLLLERLCRNLKLIRLTQGESLKNNAHLLWNRRHLYPCKGFKDSDILYPYEIGQCYLLRKPSHIKCMEVM